jgi:2-keto-4-pentenoate hydratase
MYQTGNELDAASITIAEHFVRARGNGGFLGNFPGSIPATVEAAYRCQEAAIRVWPDTLAGWKVGYITPVLRENGGDERLVGPIFARGLRNASTHGVVEFPVFVNGFAAVEAEFVFRLGTDAPPEKTQWTAAEADALVADLSIGIETAGSPLATINTLGPRVVISDFGNNAGLIVGPRIDRWRSLPEFGLTCTTFIDGENVGEGNAAGVAGGLLAALSFALSRCARNGRPLRAGDLVTTGAVTGIHDIVAGQEALADFGTLGAIRCRAVDARSIASASGFA